MLDVGLEQAARNAGFEDEEQIDVFKKGYRLAEQLRLGSVSRLIFAAWYVGDRMGNRDFRKENGLLPENV